MDDRLPFGRYRGGAPAGPEQTAGDGCHRVGVVADSHRGAERIVEVAARLLSRDRALAGGRVGGLQGGDHVAIGVEAGRGLRFRLSDPGLPEAASLGREQPETIPDTVEAALADGPVDGDAPQHAGVARQRVAVSQVGDHPSLGGQGSIVAEVGQGDRGRAHQAAVTGRAVRVIREVGGRHGRHLGRAGGCAQHRPGLDPDIRRPRLEPT